MLPLRNVTNARELAIACCSPLQRANAASTRERNGRSAARCSLHSVAASTRVSTVAAAARSVCGGSTLQPAPAPCSSFSPHQRRSSDSARTQRQPGNALKQCRRAFVFPKMNSTCYLTTANWSKNFISETRTPVPRCACVLLLRAVALSRSTTRCRVVA